MFERIAHLLSLRPLSTPQLHKYAGALAALDTQRVEHRQRCVRVAVDVHVEPSPAVAEFELPPLAGVRSCATDQEVRRAANIEAGRPRREPRDVARRVQRLL